MIRDGSQGSEGRGHSGQWSSFDDFAGETGAYPQGWLYRARLKTACSETPLHRVAQYFSSAGTARLEKTPGNLAPLLTRLDKLTFDFILAVIITDWLVGFFIWYEVIYNEGDSGLATTVGIGAGIAISLAVTVVIFAHWELVRMISERYKRMRFEEGRRLGREEGKEAARKAYKQRLERFLSESGIELTDADRNRLLSEAEEATQ